MAKKREAESPAFCLEIISRGGWKWRPKLQEWGIPHSMETFLATHSPTKFAQAGAKKKAKKAGTRTGKMPEPALPLASPAQQSVGDEEEKLVPDGGNDLESEVDFSDMPDLVEVVANPKQMEEPLANLLSARKIPGKDAFVLSYKEGALSGECGERRHYAQEFMQQELVCRSVKLLPDDGSDVHQLAWKRGMIQNQLAGKLGWEIPSDESCGLECQVEGNADTQCEWCWKPLHLECVKAHQCSPEDLKLCQLLVDQLDEAEKVIDLTFDEVEVNPVSLTKDRAGWKSVDGWVDAFSSRTDPSVGEEYDFSLSWSGQEVKFTVSESGDQLRGESMRCVFLALASSSLACSTDAAAVEARAAEILDDFRESAKEVDAGLTLEGVVTELEVILKELSHDVIEPSHDISYLSVALIGLKPLPHTRITMVQVVQGRAKVYSLVPAGGEKYSVMMVCEEGHARGMTLKEGQNVSWLRDLPWDSYSELRREDWKELIRREKANPFASRVDCNNLWPCHLDGCKHNATKAKQKLRLFKDGRAGGLRTSSSHDDAFEFMASILSSSSDGEDGRAGGREYNPHYFEEAKEWFDAYQAVPVEWNGEDTSIWDKEVVKSSRAHQLAELLVGLWKYIDISKPDAHLLAAIVVTTDDLISECKVECKEGQSFVGALATFRFCWTRKFGNHFSAPHPSWSMNEGLRTYVTDASKHGARLEWSSVGERKEASGDLVRGARERCVEGCVEGRQRRWNSVGNV